MGEQTARCDQCNYESLEERYSDDDYWWEYYCNLAYGRKIERMEGEAHPSWCPLLSRSTTERGNERCLNK